MVEHRPLSDFIAYAILTLGVAKGGILARANAPPKYRDTPIL